MCRGEGGRKIGKNITLKNKHFFSELRDVPLGTGTVFARREGDEEFLYREPRRINITEREEGIVAQFLQTRQGHSAFLEEIAEEFCCESDDWSLVRIFSGLHAGQGRQCFGSSSHQLCDFTLFFKGPPEKPVVLYYINYHGMYYHYKGHVPGCPKENDGIPFSKDPSTEKLDNFRRELADTMSKLDPSKFLVKYATLSTCDLFHQDVDLEEYLQREIPKDCCLPRKLTLWKKKWRVEDLVGSILSGETTGFVTLSMGFEDDTKGDLLEKNFGFCVQKRRPAKGELSDYTLAQISKRENLQGPEEVDLYLNRMPERTFSAKSFFGTEETISTTYFCWLVKERGLHHYSISHFLLYKFCDYSKDFLEPILERRHQYKKEGSAVGAECLKLVANGSFGYTALESKNYDTTTLKTDLSLRKSRFKLSSKFSMKNASFIGIVRSRSDQKPKNCKKRGGAKMFGPKERKKRRCSFVDDEAEAEDSEKEESEEKKEESEEDEFGFDQSCLLGIENEEGDDSTDEEETGDLNDLLCGESKRSKRDYKFLYTVTVTGKYKRIENCIPRAVAILSNSKKIFLNLVLGVLRVSDPSKVEPVYCDTDSIILSCQYPSLEENLKPGGKEILESLQIIGSEKSESSIHGKLKLEGVFSAGFFRALKVYRLFQDSEMEEEEDFAETLAEEQDNLEDPCPSMGHLKTVYTRCKGISRSLANLLQTKTFSPSCSQDLRVHKSSLRPTRAGEMTIQLERRTLAQPFNFKRSVCQDGIHSFPFD